MKRSSVFSAFVLLSAASLAALSACSLNPGNSASVRIEFDESRSGFPGSNFHSLIQDPSANLLWRPASINDFDCLVINVVGPGIPSRLPHEDPSVILPRTLAGSSCTYPGVLSQAIPYAQGGVIDLVVPAGAERLIQVMGVETNFGCPARDFGDVVADIEYHRIDGEMDAYELGRVKRDLFGPTDVSIAINYDPMNPRSAECESTSGPTIVYAFDNTSSAQTVYTYKADPNFGALDLIQTTSILTGLNVYDMVALPAGRRIIVSGQDDSSLHARISMLDVDQDGRIGGIVTHRDVSVTGQKFQAIALHPNGRYLYGAASNMMSGTLHSYDINEAEGTIAELISAPINGSAQDIAIHPSGTAVYIPSDYMGEIDGYAVDSAGMASALLPGAPYQRATGCAGNNLKDIFMRPQGTAVYAACSIGLSYHQIITSNSLTKPGNFFTWGITPAIYRAVGHPMKDWFYTLETDAGDFKLVAHSYSFAGPVSPVNELVVDFVVPTEQDLAISPDGRFLFVAYHDGSIARMKSYRIDPHSGAVSETGTVFLPTGSGIKLGVAQLH